MIKGSFFVISSSGSSCSPTLTGKSKICCDDYVAQYRHVSQFFILLHVNVPYNPLVQLIVTALPLSVEYKYSPSACHENLCRSGGIAPLIQLGTRWRSVVNFIPRTLYARAKSSQYPLNT